jgi:aspartate/methionine/tyrosine aminotransferase
MLKPAERASRMPRSAIREIMALAAERPGVIHLELGEPEFSTPAHIVAGALEAARAGWTKYTPNAGIRPLRELIATRASRRSSTPIDPARIVVTVGAVGALFTAVMSVTDSGHEVLIPDPGWPNYESIVRLAGATPVRFRLRPETGFLPDLAELQAKLTSATRAIMLNTPGNPTGAVFPRAVMEAIGELVSARDLYVISDEVYEDLVFEGEHVSVAGLGLDDQAFVVSGFSKTYAMTGWRLGYLVCPPHLAGIAATLQEPVTSCAPAVVQKAGEVALAGSQDCVARFTAIYRRRRDLVVEVLGRTGLLPVIPAGAFYALVDVSRTGRDSTTFAKEFLLAENVAVVPGATFGPSCDRFVRVAFTAADADLRTGLERLRAYVLQA